MNPANAWTSYQKVATQTASRGKLVLMLYDGALRFLRRALTGFALDDPAEANLTIHNNVVRAQDILRELDASLNVTEGGDLAVRLRGLYRYFERCLDESNRHKQQSGIEAVMPQLTTIRDAWAEMLAGQGQTSMAEAVGSAMAPA